MGTEEVVAGVLGSDIDGWDEGLFGEEWYLRLFEWRRLCMMSL